MQFKTMGQKIPKLVGWLVCVGKAWLVFISLCSSNQALSFSFGFDNEIFQQREMEEKNPRLQWFKIRRHHEQYDHRNEND